MKTRARLVGLAATLVLVALVAGIPALLLRVGADFLPAGVPSLSQVWAALRVPDDGTLVLQAVTVIAWLAWAVLAACVVVEVGAQIRGLPALRLPGLGAPQLAVRQLVGAAALLFVAVPAGLAGAGPAQAATVTRVVDAPVVSADLVPATDPAPRTYTVQPGDSLSRIAANLLGNGERWPELADLNPVVAGNPDLIYPGTVLTLPGASAASSGRSYVVQAGDTLSGIAARELGDADRYPEIFAASTGTVQADGRRITDPDVIDVGQVLTIPAGPVNGLVDTAAPSAATTPEAAAPSALPSIPATATEPKAASEDVTPKSAAAAPTQIPAGAAQVGAPEADEDDEATAPWLLAGLTGGGAILAGSLVGLLASRRRERSRARWPGRTMAPPPTVLAPVEKTIAAVGSITAPTVTHLDTALRRLAAAVARDGGTMPDLVAAQLTATDVVLHLAEPTTASTPWQIDADPLRWRLPAGTDPDLIGPDVPDQPAPYPLLVTVGVGDDESVWLLNLENHVAAITGDPVFGLDLARYVVAEIACNPWSSGAQVECVDLGAELAGLNPDRIRVHDLTDDEPFADLLSAATRMLGNADAVDADVATARAALLGADAWTPRLVLVDAQTDDGTLDRLVDLICTHPGRTAACVLLHGNRPGTPGLTLEVSPEGRIVLPDLGLDLIAVGLTSDEAQGCADLLAQCEDENPVAVPIDPDETEGWRALVDQTGALREEYTQPRDHAAPDEPAAPSVLSGPDEAYLEVAATTEQDLAVLAPQVPAATRRTLEAADTTLDRDVAAWFDDTSRLPKLRLLGPVRATTRGKALTRRKPYMTELLTFIALKPHGATPAEVAEAFGLTPTKVREYVRLVREWLGTNPRTREPHLPDARLAAGALYRGTPVYEVVDLLVDLDLFRRLRARGESRGAEGIDDLRTALRLVEGRPFDAPLQRRVGGGWTWLFDGERLDEYAAIAVVDVAHIVVAGALESGETTVAKLAAETALLAAPDEEIPRLDIAAVATVRGQTIEAHRRTADDVAGRADDEGVPSGLVPRTLQVLRARVS